MRPESIFEPMVALVLLTFAVMAFMGYKRFSAGFAGRVKAGDFRYGETANVPPDVAVVNRNFMNLLEAPVLFYALCVSLYVTRHVTGFTLGMAWAYVALRFAHTGFHLFYNRILYRFAPFALSNVVLAILWLWFAAVLFG
ncbi:MAG TPA: MAPEG family protein [Gammaproteobacteria bacterium]|nr:MAPEG family protein [Gammaproteobacteria bacterium]